MHVQLVIRSRFNPQWVRQHSFVETDHEIFSVVIISLLLIQEGQLSVSGERICTCTGKPHRVLSIISMHIPSMVKIH